MIVVKQGTRKPLALRSAPWKIEGELIRTADGTGRLVGMFVNSAVANNAVAEHNNALAGGVS